MHTLVLHFLLPYLIAVNVVTLIVYGMDKRKAKRGRWRISETTLLSLAFIGGALGAWVGMRLFHHKTKHLKFRILVPLALLFWLALVIYLIFTNLP